MRAIPNTVTEYTTCEDAVPDEDGQCTLSRLEEVNRVLEACAEKYGSDNASLMERLVKLEAAITTTMNILRNIVKSLTNALED